MSRAPLFQGPAFCRFTVLTAANHLLSFAIMQSKAATTTERETCARSEGACETYFVDEENVAAVEAAMPSHEVFEQAADEFSAFSDPTRLKILFALSLKELCVCDIARLLGRSM